MNNVTLNQIVESTLTNSGKKFRMLKSQPNLARFVVECNSVKIYGTVTNEKYSSKTRKYDGTVLDQIECNINTTDDVINRIYENINTSTKLSKYVTACNEAKKEFLKPDFLEEKEDKEDNKEDNKELLLSDDETNVVVEEAPMDLQTALDSVIQRSVDLASEVAGLVDAIPEDDTETKGDLIAVAGTFYAVADDIDDVIDELYPEDEEVNESIIRKKKSITESKLYANKISELSMLMRGKPEYKAIREALKLIRAELILK